MGKIVDSRDPFEVLDVSPDSEWRVIQAAYEMLGTELSAQGDSDDKEAARAEIEWAYEELKKPERRLKHIQRNRSKTAPYGDVQDDGRHAGGTVARDEQASLLSVVVSAGIFVAMLASVGYGLYFVGAVPPSEDGAVPMGPQVSAENTETIAKSTQSSPEYQRDAAAHTATVDALYVTATHGALLDYTSGLTATIESALAALTPTPVKFRACPNVASVNVRTGPGTAYRAIGYVLEGDCVRLTGRNDEADWIVIDNAPRPSSDGGWVSVSLMTVEGDIDELAVMEAE